MSGFGGAHAGACRHCVQATGSLRIASCSGAGALCDDHCAVSIWATLSSSAVHGRTDCVDAFLRSSGALSSSHANPENEIADPAASMAASDRKPCHVMPLSHQERLLCKLLLHRSTRCPSWMHLILARSHCSRSALFALSHSLPALATARETTMRSMLYALFATTLFLGTPLLAQDAAPQQSLAGPPVTAATYKLSFIVRQLLAGKVTESRSYPSALSQRFFASRPHPSRKQNTAGTIAIAVRNAVQLQRHRSEPRF